MLGLVLAGAVVFVIGLLAIGFGFPVKEFSFGNTLILSGVAGICSGLILIALGLVLRELRAVAAALAAGAPDLARRSEAFESGNASHPDARAAAPPPWLNEVPGRSRAAAESEPEPESTPGHGSEAEPAAAPEVPKRRRNLLFMSSKRDRNQTADQAADTDAEHSSTTPAVVETRVTFDEAWPADRSRPEPPRPSRAASQDEVKPPPPIRRPAEAPPVTVLKSGVVDGMAYTLYSDGSIEAQLPEGMIRFASIDDLRTHLEQRG
jgi:hypothetical protein